MSNKRQMKVNRLLQRDLSEIFQQDSFNIFNGTMATVTSVTSSPDLGQAKIYLSFFPDEGKEAVMEAVTNHTSAIRGELGRRIRHQFRKIPELVFFMDDTAEVASKVDELFKNIDKPVNPDEEYRKGK